MVKRLLKGAAAGIFVFCAAYFGSVQWLNQYFFSTGRLYQAEAPRAEELQKFATKHELSTEETGKLRKWAKERKIDEFMIFRDKLLLFDLSYDGEVRPGAGKLYEQRWKNLYTVAFSDGTAQVYLDEGFAAKYYDILLLGSVLLGFVVCLGIFISGLKEDVRYIQELEKQVETISRGKLDSQVSLRGKDELAQLASGLDVMRLTLIQKEEKEQEMRMAQEKLVLGMSHDLRTPLTGLLAYLEILKRQEENSSGYVDKALDKVLQIRTLSDQMFEYFLVNASNETELDPAEDISSVLGDYLSELCAFLECEGFLTDTEELVWKPVQIRVYTDYLGRIVNNIISNIQKYGDIRTRVEIRLLYVPGQVGVCVKNRIAAADTSGSGTGLGVKNICAMMEKMKGRMEINTDGDTYEMILWFPAENFSPVL